MFVAPVACDRTMITEPALPATGPSPARVAAQSDRQGALTELARAVAVSLQDPAVRAEVRKDLRESRFGHEHKLELTGYVKSNGRLSVSKLAKAAGKSDVALSEVLASGHNMELYMPVTAHRESWKGDGDLIVAAQLNDQTTPVGFHLDGTPAELSLATPPATPTLVIVPSETDFVTPLDAAKWGNTHDANGAIGTYRRIGRGPKAPADGVSRMVVDPCSGDPAGGLPPECYPSPPTYPAGLYLDYSHLDDWKESWPRGDPEVEAFLIGPTVNPAADGEKLSCSGERSGGAKYFNQDGHDWSAPVWSVEGQLYSASELAAYQEVYKKPFVIQFWEDDQESCEIRKDDKSLLQQISEDLSTVRAAASVVINLLTYSYPGTFVFSSSAVQALRALGHLNVWDNEDDYLGQITLQGGTGYNYTDMTHVLVLGTSGSTVYPNGYMRLRYRQ